MHLLTRSRSLVLRAGGGATKGRQARHVAPIAYIICTNPRSGSWLLSDGLTATGLAGRPREWFNPLVEQKSRALWRMTHSTDLSDAGYLKQVRALARSPNGACGIKLHYYQLERLLEKLTDNGASAKRPASALIASAFPHVKYIWLSRRDKARQAISYQLACATGQWWLIDGAEPSRPKGKAAKPVFDPVALARLEQTLTANDAKWRAFFCDSGVVPLALTYEELASDYSGVILRVLKWLGVPAPEAASIKAPRFRPQSNRLNENWLARYKAFKAEAGPLPLPALSVELTSPLNERALRPLEVISPFWKQWIARNKRLATPEEQMIEVLTSNGYSRQSASAEVAAARASK